jgi:hypothetical protein
MNHLNIAPIYGVEERAVGTSMLSEVCSRFRGARCVQ